MNKPFQKDNTMNFIIGDHLYAVSTDGCDCIVHPEKGDFRHNKTWNRETEKDELTEGELFCHQKYRKGELA